MVSLDQALGPYTDFQLAALEEGRFSQYSEAEQSEPSTSCPLPAIPPQALGLSPILCQGNIPP